MWKTLFTFKNKNKMYHIFTNIFYLSVKLWFQLWCFVTYDLVFSIQSNWIFFCDSPIATISWKSFIQRPGKYLGKLLWVVNSLWDGTQWTQPLVSSSSEVPFPSGWARPSDSILMNRIQQKWWVVTSKMRLPKHCGFRLGLLLLLSHLLAQREASHHAVSCSMERPRRQGPESTAMLVSCQADLPHTEPSDDTSALLVTFWIQPVWSTVLKTHR